MKDLCDRSGLPRQVVHFYINEGLLPVGRKTGRNMAVYGEEHLERLLLIKKLQREQFLPLKAIRAVLDPQAADVAIEADAFTSEQRERLREIKTALRAPADEADPVEEAWSELEAAGFTQSLGFERSDLALYERAVDAIFDAERAAFLERLTPLPAGEVGERLRRALPVIGKLLARLHERRLMRFLDECGEGHSDAE
jgi:DNA-binding transcriptional MerR regulator